MIKREVYEIKGFDFALGCVLNQVCGYEFGKTLVEMMQGFVEFEEPTTKNYRRFKIRRWKGNIPELENSRIDICEVESYLARISLVYEEGEEGISEVKKILRGIRIGKRNLEECTRDIEQKDSMLPENPKPLKPNAIYSCN